MFLCVSNHNTAEYEDLAPCNLYLLVEDTFVSSDISF